MRIGLWILTTMLLLNCSGRLLQADENAPLKEVPAKEVPATTAPGADHQSAQKFEADVHVELNYLLYLPKDYESKESWPLVLFLHGAGERGDNLEVLKKHGPPKLIAAGKEFPAIIVSPQCPKNKWWDPFEVDAFLDDIIARYKVDKDRVYVTGLSMGGFGTFALAARSANKLAAIAPICGGGDPSAARRYPKLPIWVFHGAKDPAVKLEQSQIMVDALTSFGGSPKFTIYPDAVHDSWTETYDNPEFWEWLFAQKRNPPR
jgi:predicted peptidase